MVVTVVAVAVAVVVVVVVVVVCVCATVGRRVPRANQQRGRGTLELSMQIDRREGTMLVFIFDFIESFCFFWRGGSSERPNTTLQWNSPMWGSFPPLLFLLEEKSHQYAKRAFWRVPVGFLSFGLANALWKARFQNDYSTCFTLLWSSKQRRLGIFVFPFFFFIIIIFTFFCLSYKKDPQQRETQFWLQPPPPPP